MRTTGFDKQPYVIAGHSCGGVVSSYFALSYPQNISKVVLLSVNGIEEIEEK